MDEITASQFVTSLVKNVQALCNGYIDFSTSIEIIGHIHLTIDSKTKLDYVLTEEVSKTVHDDATLFSSYSYHSKPPPGLKYEKPEENSVDTTSISASTSTATSTTTSTSSTSRHRRKSPQVPRVDDLASFSFTSVPLVMPLAQTSQMNSTSLGSLQVVEGIDSSLTSSIVVSHESDSDSVHGMRKSQQSSVSYVPDSSHKRRKNSSEILTFPVKRSRSCDTDSNSAQVSPIPVEVIKIKEEPEEDTLFFLGDGSMQGVTGQDTQQTPDFSNVVMEPVETTFVAGDDGPQLQHKPFPVMLHANPDTSLSSVPLPTSDPHITTAALSGPSTSTKPVPSTSSKSKTSSMKVATRTQMVQTTYKVHKPLKCTTSKQSTTARAAQKKSTRVTARKSFKSPSPLKTLPPRNYFSSHDNPTNYLQYTVEDMNEAIELVHGGMSVMEAAFKFGIPRATLFNRSRNGCKTHSGRCSEVFFKTHIGADFTRKRVKMPYTAKTMEEAIEAVHSGMPVIDASILYSIPRASLFIRSRRGCPTHPGRCATVATNGKLRRTKVARYQYQQLMEKKSVLDPKELIQHYPKEIPKSPKAGTSGLVTQVLKGDSPKMKLVRRSNVESTVGQPSSEFDIPEEFCPTVKLVKIQEVEPVQLKPSIENVAIESVAVEQPSSALNVETAECEPVFETLSGTLLVKLETPDDDKF